LRVETGVSRYVAPPKATAGGGFVFEDNVAAYFLSFLLTGRPPLDPALGIVSRIDFQTRADGWLVDDILLTLASDGGTRQCAFSVKSGPQFTTGGASKEFVAVAWRQFLHEGTTRFTKSRDRLGLITRPLPDDLLSELDELLKMARTEDPADLPVRLGVPGYASPVKRSLFTSLSCPEDLCAKHSLTDASTGKLMQHLVVLEADFERQSSRSLREALENCRSALVSGSLAEAQSLWQGLVGIASEYRPTAGGLDRLELVDRLRSRFRLKDYPDHQEDWRRLLAQIQQNLDGIPDRIGNKVSLPREQERRSIEAAFARSRAVVLLGPSGCGKTVIAKSWALTALGSTKVLWWNATSLEVASPAVFEHTLSLTHSLRDVLAETSDARAYIVIDGLDRVFSETSFSNLSVLVRGLRLESPASPWRVLLTCQLEESDRVQRELARASVLPPSWEAIQVGNLAPEDLEPVWQEFPALRRLTLQPHLGALLLRPRILDLLATHVSLGLRIDTRKWVGESDVIAWFWDAAVCAEPNAAMRARFFQLLGERQADSLESETPIGDFEIADLAPVDGLVQDRLCERRNDRLAFHHDLYGDWARQRILLSKVSGLSEYVEPRIASPLWHRALRLYGLHLLEKHEGVRRWRSALDSLASGVKGFDLAQDLILESVIFAADPLPILERLWPELQANGGLLLRRLLVRFLHVSTLPNPLMLQIASVIGQDFTTEAATMQRVPYWPYWLPVIRFLHNHAEDVTELAIAQEADVADAWLRRGGAEWPLRREAAELGIAAAEHMLRLKRGPGMVLVKDGIDGVAYRAGLAGAHELPERVAAFALEASNRTARPEQEPRMGERSRTVVRRIRVQSELGSYEFEMPPPWPDGPSERVDEAFRKTCLDTDALHPLILSNPTVARDVLLALVIEEPREPDEGYRPALEEDLRVETMHTWFPPLYLRGPFLFFLQSQPAEGLSLILRLINFATERWADLRRAGSRQPPSVTVRFPEGDRVYLGDGAVCFWYRDVGRAPHVVVSALMALEKWLYMQVDEKRPIGDTVDLLLRNSNSLAIVGLLIAVGKKAPALFLDGLMPLLAVPEFYRWEIQHQIANEGHQMIGWDTLPQNRTWLQFAQDWHTLPHRGVDLTSVAQYLFLNVPETREFFDQARAEWQSRIEAASEDDDSVAHLEKMVALFDLVNWRQREDAERGRVWEFAEPATLQEKNEPVRQQIEKRQRFFLLPFRCRQILDAGQPLSDDEAEKLWATAQQVLESGPLDEADSDVVDVEDGLCGVAAVLLKLQRDWLGQYPDRADGCVNQIVKTVRNPPARHEFDSEVSSSTLQWDSFCAEVVPLLWAEDPQSPALRECVALLTMSYHYKTVAILFAHAASVRIQLGEEFRRLQHFMLRWAAQRWEQTRFRYPDEPEKRRAELEAWVRREVPGFVAGSLPAELPPWLNVITAEPEMEPTPIDALLGTRPAVRGPRLDLEVIQAAYAWLPTLGQARSEGERAEWLGFWREALACTLRMLAEHRKEDDEASGTPYPWDHWVFSGVARSIAECRPDEHPDQFWRPILGLDAAAHHWIEGFLGQWFPFGLADEANTGAFLREWRAMIEFAFSSPTWAFRSAGRHWWDVDEMWCNLMGLDSLVAYVWTAERQPIVAQMRDMYQRWAEVSITRPRSALAFARFLQQPATQPILLDGLVWLEKAAADADERFWKERDLKETMAALLDSCWRSRRADLRGHGKGLAAFNSLLRRLADHQNPIALELLDRITRELLSEAD
jgi:hypothetical protein